MARSSLGQRYTPAEPGKTQTDNALNIEKQGPDRKAEQGHIAFQFICPISRKAIFAWR